MQHTTAYDALVEFGKDGPGDFVLTPAGSSSVARAATRIMKAPGAIPIVTTRTSSKKELLINLGADHVIAIAAKDSPAHFGQITQGKLARIVFHPVGGD